MNIKNTFMTLVVVALAVVGICGSVRADSGLVPAGNTQGSGSTIYEVDGCRFEIVVKNNVAMIGNGIDAGVTPPEPDVWRVVTIPSAFGDYPVGISSNAFLNFKTEGCALNFLGTPPKVVEDGAFPVDAGEIFVCFPKKHLGAWEEVSEKVPDESMDLYFWNGLHATPSWYVRNWDELKAAADDPATTEVELVQPIVQPAGAEALTVTNEFTIVTGGYDISVSNRLAKVEEGGVLGLYDSAPEKGGAVRICDRLWNGAALYVLQGFVECVDIAFVDDSASDQVMEGGAVRLDGCRGVFSGCWFVNCRGSFGGAAYLRGGSEIAFEDCVFVENKAPTGGGICSESSVMDVRRCTFAGNYATYGSAIYSRSPLAVTDCVITNNASCSAPIYIEGSKLCAVTNTLVIGNPDDNHILRTFKPYSMTSSTPSDYLSFSGGVLDALPENAVGWVPEGFEPFCVNGYWSVAVTNTLATNAVGQIKRGIFAFDPSGEPCASRLPLHPDAIVREVGDVPPRYQVLIVDGGPYTDTIGGVTNTYRIVGGNLFLGDGSNVAVSPAGAEIGIPAEIDGLPVYGISANAFSALPSSTEFNFLGAPPATVASGAFPTGARFRYAASHGAEWSNAIVDGSWSGMTEIGPFFDSWASVCEALLAGKDVTLGQDLTVSDRTLTMADGSVKPTLDFNGHHVNVPASVAQILRIVDGGALTLTDSVGGGGFEGGDAARASVLPVFELESGYLEHAGGNIEGFREVRPLIRVATNAVYHVVGGAILRCSASASGAAASAPGFVLDIDGGVFELARGLVSNCRSTGGGVPLVSISGSGLCSLKGGYVMTCDVGADAHLFAVRSDEAKISLTGAIVASNKAGGRNVADDADRMSAVTVYGGAFDVAPQAVAHGYSTESVPSPALGRNLLLVARSGSVALAQGVLTAGEFTFDPTDVLTYGLYLPLPDPSAINVTEISGSPKRWRFAVKYPVVCDRIYDLRANLLVGNEVTLSDKVVPDPTIKLPDGFVYRAAVIDDAAAKGQEYPKTPLAIKLRIYESEKGGEPVWSGETTVTPGSEGVFQVWVSDALRVASCVNRLADVFASGKGVYLGVTFPGGEECSPRRNLVSVPLVSRTALAESLDADASATYVSAPTGTVTCGELQLADGGVCSTLEIVTTNAAYNVSEMQVGGFTLYRHADNRILSPKDGDWYPVSVKTGDHLIIRASTSGFLSIKSNDGDTVPLMAVPVPAGGGFVWQSTPFEGQVRWTAIGESN